MTDRPVCFYHRNCIDGSASAAVVERREGRCVFAGMQYGLKPRIPVLAKKVYVVDFAFTPGQMRRLASEAAEVVWIDHHASNAPMCEELGWGILDTAECGSTLCWKTLFPDEAMPAILPYIRDKDLWLWELPDSREISAGLHELFPDFSFDGLLEVTPERALEVGRPAYAALQRRVTQAIKHGVRVKEPYGLRGREAMVCNVNRDISDLGERIYAPVEEGGLGLDLAICFFMRADGKWVHSLRGTRVDCAAIARERGGGGHPQAASYVAKDPFPYSEDCLDWPG